MTNRLYVETYYRQIPHTDSGSRMHHQDHKRILPMNRYTRSSLLRPIRNPGGAFKGSRCGKKVNILLQFLPRIEVYSPHCSLKGHKHHCQLILNLLHSLDSLKNKTERRDVRFPNIRRSEVIVWWTKVVYNHTQARCLLSEYLIIQCVKEHA